MGSNPTRPTPREYPVKTLRKAILLLPAIASILTYGCTLPGAISPTPFTFPTPNLTLTAIFAPTETETPVISDGSPTAEITPIATSTAATTQEQTPTTSVTYSTEETVERIKIHAQPLSTAPEIDGTLDEWSGTTYEINSVVYGAAARSGSSDLSGTFRIGWDSGSLYLAVSVTDDTFVQISSGNQMFKGDIVEFQLDANLEADLSSSTLSSDDYQIGLSPGNFASLPPSSYRWYPVSVRGALSSITIKAVQTSDGYDLEARIPWSVFGVAPAQGDGMGFALSISDNDQTGTAAQQSMVSIAPSRMLTNPTTWAKLILD